MKQKVDMYIQLADAVPYRDNELDFTKVHHWRIYIGHPNLNDYWVVCAKTIREALQRFKSFSNYELNELYIVM